MTRPVAAFSCAVCNNPIGKQRWVGLEEYAVGEGNSYSTFYADTEDDLEDDESAYVVLHWPNCLYQWIELQSIESEVAETELE